MKVAAVICELNPLHHGHVYLFEQVRKEADCIVALMSGNFVQRGDAAILDKYARAEMAVHAGADLVLELPFPWCTASAEFFAKAGTALAEKLSANTLAFGVGTEKTSLLSDAASFFADPDIEKKLQMQNRGGAAADGAAVFREKCLKSFLGDGGEDILQSPNDILAIEYLKQLQLAESSMQTQMIRRLNTEMNPKFLGATQIRSLLSNRSLSEVSDHVPEYVYSKLISAIETGELAASDKLFSLAFFALRTECAVADFIPADGDGGLFQRICRAADMAVSPEEMLKLAATKKYTNARLRRVLLYYLLKISRDILHESPAVTTVLAANKTGCDFLSSHRKSSPLSFITKPAEYRRLDDAARIQYDRILAADRLYTLCLQNPVPADYFLLQSPYIEK